MVKSFKYLGVYLHKNRNWNRTQAHIAQNASYSLHNVFSTFSNLNLPISNKVELFDKIVATVLNYRAEVWGHYQGSDVELILTKFCRKIFIGKKIKYVLYLIWRIGQNTFESSKKTNYT